jgi:outer membrane lipoprotein SlyB
MIPYSVDRVALVFLAALTTASCSGPAQQKASDTGAILSARAIDVMGKVSVARSAKATTHSGEEILRGAAAEQTMCACKGVEYVVRLDAGGEVIVAQEMAPSEQPLRAGDRVVVRDRGENQRVAAAPSA